MRRLLAACVLLLFSACASRQAPTPGASALPPIAVLPLGNETTDVSAPGTIRERLREDLAARGYRLLDAERVDEALRGLGFTEGGQLAAADPARLGEALGTRLLLYGDVIDYMFKSAVALSQRRVELDLRLVDAADGGELWSGRADAVETKAGADAAGALALHAAGKLVHGIKEGAKPLLPGERARRAADASDAVADVELASETREALRKLLESLDAAVPRLKSALR